MLKYRFYSSKPVGNLLFHTSHPEFCKELGKKSSEHRMNTGVQSVFEMHRSVVFFTHF